MLTLKFRAVFALTGATKEEIFSVPNYEKYTHQNDVVEFSFNHLGSQRVYRLDTEQMTENGICEENVYVENSAGKTIDAANKQVIITVEAATSEQVVGVLSPS